MFVLDFVIKSFPYQKHTHSGWFVFISGRHVKNYQSAKSHSYTKKRSQWGTAHLSSLLSHFHYLPTFFPIPTHSLGEINSIGFLFIISVFFLHKQAEINMYTSPFLHEEKRTIDTLYFTVFTNWTLWKNEEAQRSSSFFFKAAQYSVVWLYQNLLNIVMSGHSIICRYKHYWNEYICAYGRVCLEKIPRNGIAVSKVAYVDLLDIAVCPPEDGHFHQQPIKRVTIHPSTVSNAIIWGMFRVVQPLITTNFRTPHHPKRNCTF